MIGEKQEAFINIAKEIWTNFGRLLGTRPYIAIVDGAGIIHYIDSDLKEYENFISNFVSTNFNLLKVGDHSLPLGGINLAFFKVSYKTMIILHTKKGRSGQLLAFKSKMFDYAKIIDTFIGEVAIIAPPIRVQDDSAGIDHEPEVLPPTAMPKTRVIKTIPVIVKKLSGKEKFPLEEAQILQYCDGEHSIEEISEVTEYPRLKVDNVIKMYQKKKWIAIKRILS